MGPEKPSPSCREHRTQLGKWLVSTWVWPQKSLPEDGLHINIAANNPSPEITRSYTARSKGKSDPAAGASCFDSEADSTGGCLLPLYLGPCLWGQVILPGIPRTREKTTISIGRKKRWLLHLQDTSPVRHFSVCKALSHPLAHLIFMKNRKSARERLILLHSR